MSLLSSPYLPVRISLSSKSGLQSKSVDVLLYNKYPHSRVDRLTTISLEDRLNSLEDFITDGHVLRTPILRTLGHFQLLAFGLAILLFGHAVVKVFGVEVSTLQERSIYWRST